MYQRKGTSKEGVLSLFLTNPKHLRLRTDICCMSALNKPFSSDTPQTPHFTLFPSRLSSKHTQQKTDINN
jgi:hypothetical protein